MACPAGYTFSSTARKGPFADDTEKLRPGQRFVYWDYDIMWTEDHMPYSKLEPLRLLGDELADNALEALGVKQGQDALGALKEYVALPLDQQQSEAPRKLMDHLMKVPEWVDWEQVQRGQQVYWKYCLYISHALLHFSLAGGFSIPQISKVLTSTGYLNGDKTRIRVFETTQFILDMMHSLEWLQPGSGSAWESIVQVRFLHAGVRSRLSKISRAHSKRYSIEEHGVPINQEDLLATLFSFSNAMWRAMELRMDVHMSLQDREDYLHLWRYIGYMMGVDDKINACTSPHRADALLESIVLHLTDPDDASGELCERMLTNLSPGSSAASRWGLPDLRKVHMALAENLVGPKFWKVTGQPAATAPYRWLMAGLHRYMALDLWLVTMWPGFARIRDPLLQRIQYSVIHTVIGPKKHQFELKELPKDANIGGGVGLRPTQVQGSIWPSVLTAASAAAVVAGLVFYNA